MGARRRVLVVVLASLTVSLLAAGCSCAGEAPTWGFSTYPPRPALQFSPATLPDAQVGSSYAATITVSQAVTPVGDARVEDGALPAGLDLALAKEPDNTILISGTPTVAGTFSFTIYVWCYGTMVSGQTATQGYTLVVK